MDGIHDMGGMHGFGRIPVEPDEPLFHHQWERRVFALNGLILAAGVGNLDQWRHAIERMPPLDYLGAGYYGRWLAAMERVLDEEGLVSAEEHRRRIDHIASGTSGAEHDPATPPAPPGRAPRRSSLRPLDAAPRFAVGDRVRSRDSHPPGHTRLPRYARGKRGRIAIVHASCVFPDTNAHQEGENPQYVYAVRFAGEELWGPDAEPRTTVHLDLFESYLRPLDDGAEAARTPRTERE